jgi:hypothetical protein
MRASSFGVRLVFREILLCSMELPTRCGISVNLPARSLFPNGTKIDVLYYPTATETLWQSESLRVLEAQPDLWQHEAGEHDAIGNASFAARTGHYCNLHRGSFCKPPS